MVMKHGLFGVSVMALMAATPAFGQSASPVSASADDDASAQRLQEIVVTAQKRSENLQNVPIAVTVASGAELTARGITETMQLNTLSPGLNLRTAAGAFQPFIRGIGTSSNVVENPVALYIDGVYFPNQREGLRQLDDIAQVAVLKGPQGTLFGRNATGGVIQITTLAPSHDFEGTAKAEIDTYATVRGSIYLTGGIGENAAASLSASYAHQGQGWGTNLATGNDTFKIKHDFSTRAKLLFEPGDRTSITLIADYMDRQAYTNSFVPYQNLPLQIPGAGQLESVYDTNSAFDGTSGFRGGGVSLTVDHDLSFAKLLSITSYRRGKVNYDFQVLPVPSPVVRSYTTNAPTESFTQELQLMSPTEGAFKWVAGAYLYYNALGTMPAYRMFSGALAPNPTSTAYSETRSTETTESLAPFAQASWEFLPDTTLTLGGRYTYERRKLEDASVIATRVDGTMSTTVLPDKRLSIEKATFRFALDHKFTPEILGYVSTNTGFKSGGYNIVSPANAAYLPEKLTAYEVGLKTELFDRRVRLNIAAFYYDYTNLQVVQYVGLTQTVVNGPKAELYGIDIDFEAQLTDELRLSGALEAEHATFTDYPGAVFSMPTPGGGATVFPGDATGNRLPFAQELSGTLAVDYHKEMQGGALDFNVTANYNGDYYFEADNFLRQKAYTILNSSLKWTIADSPFSFTIFGKNLLDEKVITQVVTYRGYPAVYARAPRTYGIGVALDF